MTGRFTPKGSTGLPGGFFVFPFQKGAKGIAPRSAWTQDQGVDIAAPGGTPILAAGAGTIVQEGIPGFGPNAPILELNTPIGGERYVYYGHSGPDAVPVGAHVAAGQQITEVGYGIVGISTGPHLEIGTSPTQSIPASGETSGKTLQLLDAAQSNASIGSDPISNTVGAGVGAAKSAVGAVSGAVDVAGAVAGFVSNPVPALVTIALVALGAVLIFSGVTHALGVDNPIPGVAKRAAAVGALA